MLLGSRTTFPKPRATFTKFSRVAPNQGCPMLFSCSKFVSSHVLCVFCAFLDALFLQLLLNSRKAFVLFWGSFGPSVQHFCISSTTKYDHSSLITPSAGHLSKTNCVSLLDIKNLWRITLDMHFGMLFSCFVKTQLQGPNDPPKSQNVFLVGCSCLTRQGRVSWWSLGA